MSKKTSIEIYLNFRKHEPNWDFSLFAISEKLGITPTDTKKVGEWNTPKRRSTFTEWIYSTGAIETIDFEMGLEKIVDTFKDKVDTINEIKKELGVETSICAVTHVIDGNSPGYSFPVEVMKFAVSIDTFIEIDEYVYGFVENDLDEY
ncbi:DUF4279 domain-containing protein [Ornithinibacillus salinisoli]|uniref:DUF4279 domain-containing protein n=1 Tax=Ornithinibacillus salinisoli TaxID=1848459 RepID=A0ABW4W2F0_9BACI